MNSRSAFRRRGGILGLAVVSSVALSAARAQDVGNGLWQNYRYPASNPNWQDQYNMMVSTWGWNPQGLRPVYNSSPDAVFSVNNPSASSFTTQPFYTITHWQPYLTRPVDWNGLEYSVGNAPPETLGKHGWYGMSSPGPRGETPQVWQDWENDTEAGQDYLVNSGLRRERRELPKNQGQLPVRYKTEKETVAEQQGLKELILRDAGKPGKARWIEREQRPKAPDVLDLGEFKQVVVKAAQVPGRAGQPAQGKGAARAPQLFRPDGAPARAAAPRSKIWIYRGPPDHDGFAQFYQGPLRVRKPEKAK